MQKLNGLLLLVLSIVLSSTISQAGSPGTLTVTSYNLRWFGLGGDLENTPADENRDQVFRDFIAKDVPSSDVFVFEEIVDKERLQNAVVPKGFECISYEHDGEKHQFVVMCASPEYRWAIDPSDNNYGIEEVALGQDRYRQATHALLLGPKNIPVARIVGVHLKAIPNFSKERQQQITILAAALKKMEKDIPTLITGDFNSFTTKENGGKEDDVVAFTRIFQQSGLGFTEAKNPSKNTSWSPKYESKLDRFFVDSRWANATVRTGGFCNDPSQEKRRAYFSQYSDHCPITIDVPLK